jgi:O-antigen chain-terminating methyltransferase
MIETNIPDINVTELMARVREHAAKLEQQAAYRPVSAPAIAALHLPALRGVPQVPVVSPPKRVKFERKDVLEKLSLAQRGAEGPKWLPKFLRSLFRRQGVFNHRVVEASSATAKATAELANRVREIAASVEAQSHSLRALVSAREADIAWMRAAGAMLAVGQDERQRLTAELQRVEAALMRRSDEQSGELKATTAELQSTVARMAAEQLAPLREEVQALHRDAEAAGEHLRNLDARFQHTELVTAPLRDQLDGVTRDFRALRSDADRSGEHLRNLQAQVDREFTDGSDLRRAIERLDERLTADATYIKGELSQQRASLLQLAGIAPLSAPADATATRAVAGAFDAFYVSFEDRFRGPRDEIKHRLAFYLPLVRDLPGTSDRPVVDVGCGRGEWLELLQENGFAAAGVDLNERMVAQCTERGFAAVHGDAIAHLRSLAEGSCRAVSGFHIIEHLPFDVLMALLTETYRVLQPGGIAIFESPNCKNISVGASTFNLDPTHRNPVFPETAQFMLESQGFADVRLEYLSSGTPAAFRSSDEDSAALRELFYGPQDFAVIGRKPA